jgi:hypothetical protein
LLQLLLGSLTSEERGSGDALSAAAYLVWVRAFSKRFILTSGLR